MLSLVGHPYAINPDAALREHARAAGWQIVDYRPGRRAAKLGLRAAAATALAGALAASAAAARLTLPRRGEPAARRPDAPYRPLSGHGMTARAPVASPRDSRRAQKNTERRCISSA